MLPTVTPVPVSVRDIDTGRIFPGLAFSTFEPKFARVLWSEPDGRAHSDEVAWETVMRVRAKQGAIGVTCYPAWFGKG